jgi:hypothetical protein
MIQTGVRDTKHRIQKLGYMMSPKEQQNEVEISDTPHPQPQRDATSSSNNDRCCTR